MRGTLLWVLAVACQTQDGAEPGPGPGAGNQAMVVGTTVDTQVIDVTVVQAGADFTVRWGDLTVDHALGLEMDPAAIDTVRFTFCVETASQLVADLATVAAPGQEATCPGSAVQSGHETDADRQSGELDGELIVPASLPEFAAANSAVLGVRLYVDQRSLWAYEIVEFDPSSTNTLVEID